MLYHLSEKPHIKHFLPRPSPLSTEPVVWAVSEDRLRNYLLPRDCPRVTFFPAENSSPEDIARHLGPSPAVVAVEAAWLDRIRQTRLYCYHLPETTFRCIDLCAGYHTSPDPVTPHHIEIIDDLLAALTARQVEIRILPSLWPLRDAIAQSTLNFSMIRMRNAAPRPTSFVTSHLSFVIPV